MSMRETEVPDCPESTERVGLKRKLTGPPRLLLGKSKSREKSDSQRKQRRDKCCEDTPETTDKQQDDKGKDIEPSHVTHHSLQKASEMEEIETHPDAQDTMGILVTLEENQSKEENLENKAGMTRSTSKTTIKRTFSSLLCSGRKMKESDTQHAKDRTENRNSQEMINKAHTDMCNSYENKQCDANNKTVAHGKGKRNFFFMLWPISKRSSNVDQRRQCRKQKTPQNASFKNIYRIFSRRKKAHPPVDQLECDASTTMHNKAEGDQVNQLSTVNMEIPSIHKQEHQKEEEDTKQSAQETFTFSAEVSINTNTESVHIHDEQEICPDQDVGKIVLSTIKEEKHPVLESTNDEILQAIGLLDSCPGDGRFDSELHGTSIALGDTSALIGANQEKSDKNDKRCKPVITIDRVYSPEEENQEVSVSEVPKFDFLSMNGSWQHLKTNSLTDNTLHPSDPSVSPQLDHSRCNETLLIQTAISMVQAAIRGAVEQLANEQQQNQISLDSA